MDRLLKRLRKQFPGLIFVAGKNFYWSPASAEVHYVEGSNDNQAVWSLLHETCHALLNHARYLTDMDLLLLEVAAWERAKMLSQELAIPQIKEEHIQDCLDTYRDWLYTRSTCPACGMKGLQADSNQYQCFNCHTVWKVSRSRFCRPYRIVGSTPKPQLIIP